MHKIYYPELNEFKPMAHGDARLSHYGKHYYITTQIKLMGHGIEKVKDSTYKVTLNAFEKLCKKYVFSTAAYLD